MTKSMLSLAMLTLIFALPQDLTAAPVEQGGGKSDASERRARRGPAANRQLGERDPAEIAARMLKQFDKDGDQKIDAEELTELLKSMRSRISRGSRAGRPGEGAQNRQRNAEMRSAGGDRPKRPQAQ